MQWLVTFCLTRFNTTTFECDASLPLNIIPLAPSYIGFDDVLLYSIPRQVVLFRKIVLL